MPTTPRIPLLVNLTRAIVVMLVPVVLYVLSYAPAYRWQMHRCGPWDGQSPGSANPEWVLESVYWPVEGLTDHTPLREPLILWADLWGSGRAIRGDSVMRQWLADFESRYRTES